MTAPARRTPRTATLGELPRWTSPAALNEQFARHTDFLVRGGHGRTGSCIADPAPLFRPELVRAGPRYA